MYRLQGYLSKPYRGPLEFDIAFAKIGGNISNHLKFKLEYHLLGDFLMTTILRNLAVLLTLCLLCGCSEDANKQSTIEKQTEKIAQEGVEYIQAPLDKAQSAVDDMNKAIERKQEEMQ